MLNVALATCQHSHAIGQRLREAAVAATDESETTRYADALMYWSYGWYFGMPEYNALDWMSASAEFVEAGWRNYDEPLIVTGWRYGAVPASGRSRNHRDGQNERGVSMMHVGGSDVTPDGSFAIFNGSRPVVHVRGILLPWTGSDGEPLLICCETLRAEVAA